MIKFDTVGIIAVVGSIQNLPALRCMCGNRVRHIVYSLRADGGRQDGAPACGCCGGRRRLAGGATLIYRICIA